MAKKTEQRQTYHLAVVTTAEEMDLFTGVATGRPAAMHICPKPIPADSRLTAEKFVADKKPADLLKLLGIEDMQLVTVPHYVFVVTLPARKLSCTVLRPVEKIVRFIEAEQIEATLKTGFAEGSDKTASEDRVTTETERTASGSSLPTEGQNSPAVPSSHASLVVPSSEAHSTRENTPPSEKNNSETPAKPEEEKREPVPDIPGVV